MNSQPSRSEVEQREKSGKLTVILLVVGITLLFLAMIRSFLVPLLLAGVFSGMCYPLFRGLTVRLGARPRLAAIVTLVVVLFLVIVPVSLFLGIVVSQALRVSETVGPWIDTQLRSPDALDLLLARIPQLEWLRPYQDQVVAKTGELAGVVGGFLVTSVASATRGTASFLLDLFVMLYAMFFFFVTGPTLLARMLYYLPLPPTDEARMIDKFVSVTRATLKGSLVIGLVQGMLAGLGFYVAGIPSVAFWGTVMAVLSIIPAIGSGLVWVPAVIYLFATGQAITAILLFVWCAAVVGTVDNFMRPWLIGKDTRMPDLLILLGTLGGLILFGAVGFIIGPIVAALFVTAWDIYGRVFQSYLPGEVAVPRV
ncbi:MAG: AI-2E family transporter [Gemmatimonadota bacterium]|nr:AI-2E family transporter [Gemmatimonadota bacterium]MDH3427044.1 AI-2E family transporter [Gemmatimonadota bacterium]